MARLYKQKGIELMRWRVADGREFAYFSYGAILVKPPNGHWVRFGTWKVAELADVKAQLRADGAVQIKSMGQTMPQVQP